MDTPMSESGMTDELLPGRQVLTRLAISESGFVFDPVSGHSFTANETGLVILRHLQQGHDLRQLLRELADEYDAVPRDLERDVVEFIGTLRRQIGPA